MLPTDTDLSLVNRLDRNKRDDVEEVPAATHSVRGEGWWGRADQGEGRQGAHE